VEEERRNRIVVYGKRTEEKMESLAFKKKTGNLWKKKFLGKRKSSSQINLGEGGKRGKKEIPGNDKEQRQKG